MVRINDDEPRPAKYKIEGAPKGRAYLDIFTGDPQTDGPRLVKEGAVVHVKDSVIPGKWMKPMDAAAKAAVARRDGAGAAA